MHAYGLRQVCVEDPLTVGYKYPQGMSRTGQIINGSRSSILSPIGHLKKVVSAINSAEFMLDSRDVAGFFAAGWK